MLKNMTVKKQMVLGFGVVVIGSDYLNCVRLRDEVNR